MKLKLLKETLSRFPPDMDDMEVILNVSRNGKSQRENICSVAYVPVTGAECIILGGLTEVQRQFEAGEIEKPENYVDPKDSDPLIFGKNSKDTH